MMGEYPQHKVEDYHSVVHGTPQQQQLRREASQL